MVRPLRKVAYDINEKSVAGVSSEEEVIKHDLTEHNRLRVEYTKRRAKSQVKKTHDKPTLKKALTVLGKREKEGARRIPHKTSKAIVEQLRRRNLQTS